MDRPPGHDQDEPVREADKQANVMKDQLRKEVAVWNAARSETSAKQEADFGVPVPPRPASRPATKQAKRAKPAETSATKPAGAPKKPFSMSFDGVTDAEHIKYIIARGAR
jgi:hypothetical protein